MTLIQPFNIERILITDVAGSIDIAAFLFIILLGFAMAKFNLPSKVSLPIFALYGIISAAYFSGLFALIILIAGIITFYSLSKIGR